MDNLRAVIKNLFCHVSAEQIINEQIIYNKILKLPTPIRCVVH